MVRREWNGREDISVVLLEGRPKQDEGKDKFQRQLNIMLMYLGMDVGLNGNHMKRVAMQGSRPYEVLHALSVIAGAAAARNQNLAVVYAGHGNSNGIFPTQDIVPYGALAYILKEADVPLLYVDGSCRSGACIPVFRKHGLLPERCGVITASTAEQLAYGSAFLDGLTQAWGARSPYEEQEFRWTVDGNGQGVEGKEGKKVDVQNTQRAGKVFDHWLYARKDHGTV